MNVVKKLEELGFRKNDAKIYVQLLSEEVTTSAKIAKSVGFSRSYTYDALKRLEIEGIVSTTNINGVQEYTAISPTLLAEIATQKAENMKSLVPILNAIGKEKNDMSVEVHKGKYAYRTLLADIVSTMQKNETVLIFGIDDQVLLKDKWIEKRLELYFAKAKRLGIKEKAIVSPKNSPPKNALTHYKNLPAELFDGVAYEVYGDTLALFLNGSADHLILIKNKQIANSYRRQFALLWKLAK